MKRIRRVRRERRMLERMPRGLGRRSGLARVDGRVTQAVLWALGRLAMRLGPA